MVPGEPPERPQRLGPGVERGAGLTGRSRGEAGADHAFRPRDLGLYLHIPYCSVRCSYCDFFLVPARGKRLDEYARALAAEVGAAPPEWRRPADTVHLGGGTPSLLTGPLLGLILGAARAAFTVVPGAEIALEANPEDLDADRLQALADQGVDRLTIGVQSLDDRLLRALRRPHTAREARSAIERARRAPLRSLGIDLILGLPGQDRASALRDLGDVVDLGVDHLSLYLLELHPRTRLGREVGLGRRSTMPDDDAAGLYEEAADRLAESGFEHYEISNFARAGHRSRHNVKYWTDRDYLGFGPSAHSYIDGRRFMNRSDLNAYLAAGGLDPHPIEERQSPTRRAEEALCAGLRLLEGVDLEALRLRYGEAIPGPDDPRLAELETLRLVERNGSRLRLTRRGRLVSNEVFLRLLAPEQAPSSHSRESGGGAPPRGRGSPGGATSPAPAARR